MTMHQHIEVSRQVLRQGARMEAKTRLSNEKLLARKAAKRTLLDRQSLREKEGLYSAPSVASAKSPSRSRLNSRKVNKGSLSGRIILTKIVVTPTGNREHQFHATKGWRSYAPKA